MKHDDLSRRQLLRAATLGTASVVSLGVAETAEAAVRAGKTPPMTAEEMAA